MITRRLDAEERRAIVPGNVYIWEERCANAEITGLGMERCFCSTANVTRTRIPVTPQPNGHT
ncbi:hypothetical protein EIP86_003117 [Pleurotus ostreatoroseus]|nr:hypothetical protein EIP86_003117 [Pleurotus ostreatoroseus]